MFADVGGDPPEFDVQHDAFRTNAESAAVCIYRDTNLRTPQRAAIPSPITNAKPSIRPDDVLLLQPWSTALIQSRNSRIAPTAIPFSHIADPPLETVVWANARVGASAAVTG
jgi:hypothetical protein